MSSTGDFVSTDAGVRLYVRTAGSGGPIVLVPNGLYLMDDFAPLTAARTLVFYDVRNRGRSDAIADPALLSGGVEADAEDIDAVRRHFGAERVDLIGHSYVGLTVVVYAMRYPDRVSRVVQIAPIQPDQSTTFPPERANHDATFQSVMAAIGALQNERASLDPVDFCRRFWSALRPLYVTDPADARRIRWDRCDLPNERRFRQYWLEHLMPSMQRLDLSRDALAALTAPVLTIHGTKDRSSPYGAAQDWVARLPRARLVAVEGAGHAPWIEDPVTVFDAIDRFLN